MVGASTSSKPRVQIPLGAKYHGLSIDGEFVNAWPQERDHPGDEDLPTWRKYLPEQANDAYWAHYGTDNLGWVYQCAECGYLSMSKKARASAYKKATCTNCKKNGHVSTSWKHVYPNPINSENHVDVLSVEAGVDVPNHPTHLGRIKNQMKTHVTQTELRNIVAVAVEEAREKGFVEY